MIRLRNYKKLGIVFVSLILVYALLGFVVIPAILEAKLPAIVTGHIGKPVVVKDIQLNPFALSINIHGFEIKEQDQTPLLGFQELFINFQLSSLYRGAMTFDQIRLVMPYGVIIIRPDGTVNISDLNRPQDPVSAETSISAKTPPASSQEPGLPAIDIFRLSIEKGIVEFHDETRATPFVADIVPIDIALENFSTNPSSENPYAVTAEITEGGTLSWQGVVSLEPVWSKGTLDVKGLNLRTVWEYLQDVVQFEIVTGLIDLGTQYQFELGGDKTKILLTSTDFHLHDFNLTEKGNSESLISIPSFDIEGVTVDVSKKRVEVPSIISQDARFLGWLNPDGKLNYLVLFSPPDGQEEPPPAIGSPHHPPEVEKDQTTDEEPWFLLVQELMIQNYEVNFEDRSLANTARINLDSINFQVRDVSTDLTKPINLALGLTINETGRADVKGSVQIEPLIANLDVSVTQLGLPPFQPYVDPFMQMNVVSGAFDLEGQAKFQKSSEGPPGLTFQGKTGLSRLLLASQDPQENFLRWNSLSVDNLAVQVNPTSLSIGEIALSKPLAKVVRFPDGTLNVTRALSPPTRSKSHRTSQRPKKEIKPSESEEPVMVPVTIDRIKIDKAAVHFADRSLKPNARVGIQDFTGTISGLSSEELSKAQVNLQGKIDKYAPFQIKGQINPLSDEAYTDLTFLLKSWGLTGISPYSGKYAGYPITQGKLSLHLDYKLNHKILEGENKLLLNQLTMGQATNSPDAPSLPIPLALALLKDRRGRIDIDMPVRGNLNDPEFSYWGLVFQALGNIITKAAISPFSALGGILGDDAESLSVVEFPSGEVNLNDQEREKLTKLAKALNERPGLRLEIAGSADPNLDRQALANKQLQTQLKQAKVRELQGVTSDGSKQVDQVDLDSEDENRLIETLYEEKFGRQPSSQTGGVAAEGGGPSKAENHQTSQMTVEAKKQKLLENISVPERDLRNLARTRAQSIRDHLVQQGQIPAKRLFIIEPNLNPVSTKETVQSTLALAAG